MDSRHYRLVIKLTMKGKGINETSEFIIKPQMLPNPMSDNLISTKLDKMLFILEEQRDFKTSSVTEDVILYSFLGIFVIVIVDSFTKVGQYTR